MRKINKGPVVVFIYTVLFAVAFCMLFPFLWMILSGFKDAQEILAIPPTLYPQNPTFENYIVLWEKFNFAKFFANSIFVTVTSVVVQIYSATLFGYVMNKYEFRAKKPIFIVILFCMMVPSTVNIIPMYQMMLWFKWIDTYRSLIIPNLITLFGIFMMHQFAKSIPNEIIEAARIDGAGEFKIFNTVCLPLFKNPISALSILQFLWTWDSYMWPLLMLTDINKYTITLGLGALNGQHSTPIEKMLAGASIAVVPVLIMYLIFQRRFVEGMSGASVKG